MLRFKIIYLLLFISFSYGEVLKVNENSSFNDLLPFSQIYIDKSKSLNIKDVKNIKFKENSQKLLGFGYSPDFDVWIKFTISNTSSKELHKIIEYDNNLTSSVQFFSLEDRTFTQEGLYHIKKDRKSINPAFNIKLNPYETKTYYIKASSYITTLILKVNLWERESFYKEEIKHQVILSLFFGAMSILALYNLFIFFFTKDLSYMFYVLYIVGIIVHHLFYVGIINVYLDSKGLIPQIIAYASLITALPTFALALFTKYFLRTHKYPRLNAILNIYIILFPLLTSIFIITDEFNKFRNIFSVFILILLINITIYAAIKRNRQAYFVLFGWCIFLAAGLSMYLSSLGLFNIYLFFPYFVEVTLVLEAILFSIALADRIKTLQKEKEDVNNKLILQQQNENIRLEQKVEEKTHDLKIALDEKGLLLKELNHRVKNNMQTIVSLIRLQSDDVDDEKLKEVLVTIQNRISAMGHLHELLYMEDNISHIDTSKYFNLLIEEVEQSYNSNITITQNISAKLKIEEAIYCGLIVNELISNSFKYAFPNKEGNITIDLQKHNNIFHLIVKDNGIGYDKNSSLNSLGLILIETLAKDQLKGQIKTNSDNGVEVIISWSNNE